MKSVYDILFTPDEPDEPAATPPIAELLSQILAELKTISALLKK